jgi:hypothetical protein
MAVGALALVTGLVSQAQAANLQYCDQQVTASTYCYGPDHALTGNEAFNYYGNPYSVCAGALLYGSYICGSAYAKHCYSGANTLTPGILNNEAFTQHIYGWEYWGADPCP